MSTKKPQPKLPTGGMCAHPECKAACNTDQFCSGCKRYTCEKHSTNDDNIPWGAHHVELHWEGTR